MMAKEGESGRAAKVLVRENEPQNEVTRNWETKS